MEVSQSWILKGSRASVHGPGLSDNSLRVNLSEVSTNEVISELATLQRLTASQAAPRSKDQTSLGHNHASLFCPEPFDNCESQAQAQLPEPRHLQAPYQTSVTYSLFPAIPRAPRSLNGSYGLPDVRKPDLMPQLAACCQGMKRMEKGVDTT